MIKPARFLSKGRDAFSGASLYFVAIAVSAQNPAKATGVMAASLPP